MNDTAANTGGAFIKADDDQRIVWGWASVIEEGGKPVFDTQGDVITEADLMDAAHGFMVEARKGGILHERRDGAAIKVGEVVESMLMTRDRQAALGIDLGKSGWLIAMKVHDDAVWGAIKEGVLKAFSIGGRGLRIPIEPAE